MGEVVHMPLPHTLNQDEIDTGRVRALEMYQTAKSDKERVKALFWVNHWRVQNEALKQLLGLSPA